MKVGDDISRGTLECKWVKVFKGLIPQTTEIVDINTIISLKMLFKEEDSLNITQGQA